jgi:secondary thiamine-phosphate synthase enzyme
LVPAGGRYTHGEGNSDAHVKAAVIGSSRTVFIAGGRLALGTWQGIFFCEFDGPRDREVWVEIRR